jgi:nicotinamidase-related amidase
MSDWKIDDKPVLLILHMQNAIVDHNRELLVNSGVIRNQQALLKAFRNKRLPVIFVNVMLNPPVAGKLPAYGLIWKQVTGSTNKPGDLEVIPELAPQPGEPVLINWPTGAFNNSGLDRALRLCGAQTLVAAGFSTNGVVYSLMQGAADRYYSTILPRDASAAASIKAHEVFMDLIAPSISLVTDTQDVIAHL